MGKFRIIINSDNFAKGASQFDDLFNGGFSPEDKGHNLHKVEGLLYPQPSATENTGTVNDIIAWSEVLGALGVDSVAVGESSNDGYFYTLDNDGVATLKATDTSQDYNEYRTHLIYYKSKFYCTHKNGVAQLGKDMVTGNDYSFKSLSTTYSPRPMVIFDNILYVANDENLASFDGSTWEDTALTIDNNYYITAMTIYQNKFYIAAEPCWNAGGGNKTHTKIFVWDGVNDYYVDVDLVPDHIDFFYNFNGQLLFFTSNYMAYWNGINFMKLRRLSSQVYAQMVARYEDRLYFVQSEPFGTTDRYHIVCYDGTKFYSIFTSTESIKAINLTHNETLVISCNNKTYTIEIDGGDGSSNFRGNKYNFGSNAYLRSLIVELGETMESGSEMDFYFYDHNGEKQTIGTMSYANGDRKVKKFKGIDITTLEFQPSLYFKTNAKPIKQLTYEFETTDDEPRQP